MTPTRQQIHYAQGRPSRNLTGTTVAVFVFAAALACGSVGAWMLSRQGLLLFLTVLGLASLLGWLVSVLLGVLFLSPQYAKRGIENGGPFVEGDMVQILAGKHRGRIARVYSGWQQGLVRVDLGPEEARRFKDIFAAYQLLREAKPPLSQEEPSKAP